MGQFDEVIQLNEDIEVPDGYNWVEITGTGDERKVDVFAKIEVSSDLTQMKSDGKTVAKISTKITSYKALNPYQHVTDVIEKVVPEDIFNLSTSKWIVGTPLVYENYDPQTGIFSDPIPIDHILQNKIHVVETWVPTRLPNYADQNWTGFFIKEAWVKYTTCESIAVSVGKKSDDPNAPGYIPWWINPETVEVLPENECGGDYFYDVECENPIWLNEIAIPNTTGNIVTLTYYFRPTKADSGTAYIYAAYDGNDGNTTIVVTAGGAGSITLEAIPSTIPVGGSCSLEATVSAEDGTPLTSGTVSFYVVYGEGSIRPGSDTIEPDTEDEEETMSSQNTEVDPKTNSIFSLSKPIVKIKSIEALTNVDWTWNGQYTVTDATTVHLVDQQFPFSQTKLKVTYVWGGMADTIFTAADSAKIGDRILVGASVGDLSSAPAEIIIGEAGSKWSINLTAETPLRQEPTPDLPQTGVGGAWGWVKVIATKPVYRQSIKVEDESGNSVWNVEPTIFNEDLTGFENAWEGTGPAESGDIDLSVLAYSGGLSGFLSGLSVKSERQGNAEATLSSIDSCSTEYPITSVDSSVSFLGSSYPVKYFDGNTIYIDGKFPVASSTEPVILNYDAGGFIDAVFHSTDPGSAQGYRCNIVAKAGDTQANQEVVVGYPPEDATISLSIKTRTGDKGLEVDEVGVVSASFFSGPNPQMGEMIRFSIVSGGGAALFADDANLRNTYPFNGPFANLSPTKTKETGDTAPELDGDGNPKTPDLRGVAQVNLKAMGRTGIVRVMAEGPNGASSSLVVEINPKSGTSAKEQRVSIATITGTILPNKIYSLTPGWEVTNWGSITSADEYGGTNETSILPVTLSAELSPDQLSEVEGLNGSSIQAVYAYQNGISVSCDFFQAILGSMRIEVEVPLVVSLNKNKQLVVEVTQYVGGFAEDGVTRVSDYTKPVSGASVRLSGMIRTTDYKGLAYFDVGNLSPGTYDIDIVSSNHMDNRVGIVGLNAKGIADGTSTNDKYVVPETSQNTYLIDPIDVNISIVGIILYYSSAPPVYVTQEGIPWFASEVSDFNSGNFMG